MRVPLSSGSGSKTPCCSKVGIKRGPWTPEEDELLSNYVKKEGEGRWRTLPKRAGLQRCGKSCRLRWMNYLRPSVKRGHIDPDEEDLILRLHRLLGNRWSLIAGRIPGRTDNEIKNYWNTHLSKKLISQGIDPRTHKPLDVPSPSSPVAEAKYNNFVPTSTWPPQQPYPNVSTLDKANGGQHQPISIAQDAERVISERDQLQSRPIAIDVGNWQCSNGMVMDPQLVHHVNNNDGKTYTVDSFNNEDLFTTFLDTLMDDNYANPYQRPVAAIPPPLVSTVPSTPNFNSQGGMWDAELIRSALETLGDQPDYTHNLRRIH